MKSPNYMLKALRTKHKATQQDVAKKLGIGETTYNRKENGITDFTISEAKKICEIFNASPNEIFFNKDVTECITMFGDCM